MAGFLKSSFSSDDCDDDDERRRQLNRQRSISCPPPISERKLRRNSSCEKLLVGDSLNVSRSDKVTRMMTRNGESRVLFSDNLVKVNHRYKPQDRCLVITEGSLYNLDPLTMKCKRRIVITNVTHISVSQLADNFFVVHVPAEYDYLYVSRRKTEIISHLKDAYFGSTKIELEVAVQNMVDYQVDKENIRRLEFIKGDGGVYTKIYAKKCK